MPAAAVAAVILTALRSWSWRSYLNALAADGAPTRTLAVLATYRPWFFAFGLALPVLLMLFAVAVTNGAPLLLAVAGGCIAGSGGLLKFILVTRAGFNQGFALAHTPVRGAGMAGPAVKPGWRPAVPQNATSGAWFGFLTKDKAAVRH
jgi:phenylacetyl-CoA:acceptor oxidoreductase subunit 2